MNLSSPPSLPDPGTPTRIPITPKPGPIVAGLVLCLVSIWLTVVWLPSHEPLTALEIAARVAQGEVGLLDEWRFKPGAFVALYLVAALIGAAGLSAIVRGAFYRTHREVVCRRCR